MKIQTNTQERNGTEHRIVVKSHFTNKLHHPHPPRITSERLRDNKHHPASIPIRTGALQSHRPMCHQSKVSCRPTPFFFLTLRGTTVATVCESTAAGVRLVLWCADVGMTVSHVISFWMFLGVCARSSLSGRKSSSPCYTGSASLVMLVMSQVVRGSSISVIASERIIGAHSSTIKTLLSSSRSGGIPPSDLNT